MSMRGLFAVGLLAASTVALTAASASAATVINSVIPATLNVAGPTIGTIDGLDVTKPNDYDWTFDIAGNPAGGLSQLQASFVANFKTSTSEPIAFSLFSGAPGSGTLIETSALQVGPSLFNTPLAAGDYFIQLTSADIAQSGEEVSGSVQLFPIAATPEPATWAMMLIGVGMAGGALRAARKSRRLPVVRTA
jgi:hypothetical protein